MSCNNDNCGCIRTKLRAAFDALAELKAQHLAAPDGSEQEAKLIRVWAEQRKRVHMVWTAWRASKGTL